MYYRVNDDNISKLKGTFYFDLTLRFINDLNILLYSLMTVLESVDMDNL